MYLGAILSIAFSERLVSTAHGAGADFVGKRLNTLFAESVSEAALGILPALLFAGRPQLWQWIQDEIIKILTPIFSRYSKAGSCVTERSFGLPACSSL